MEIVGNKMIERVNRLNFSCTVNLVWKPGVSELAKLEMISSIVRLIPNNIIDSVTVNTSGKRWPLATDYPRFKAILARRGAKDITGLIITEPQNELRFSLGLHSRVENNLKVDIPRNFLDVIFPTSLIEMISAIVNIRYGIQYNNCFTPGALICTYLFETSSIATEPKLRLYERLSSARARWQFVNNVFRSEDEQKFRDFIELVFPTSVLTATHLDTLVPSTNLKLCDWVGRDGTRGQLRAISSTNTLWIVPPEHLEKTIRELWATGFIVGSEFFEIVGWDEDLLIPQLEEKPSLAKFLDPLLE